MKRTHGYSIAFLGVAWCVATACGFAELTRYATTPGDSGASTIQWPEKSDVLRSVGAAQAVMFAHPRCSCTRASITELIQIIEDTNAHGTVVFWVPPANAPDVQEAESWRTSPTIRLVEEHPLLTAEFDPGGTALEQFGVATSGHCLVYDSAGALRFSGGVTTGRGHEGPNQSHAWIASILQGKALDSACHANGVAEYPVFGCRIQ